MVIKEAQFYPAFQASLPFYRWFIDDIIGLWLCDLDPEEDEQL
jgi:hypothetical protein